MSIVDDAIARADKVIAERGIDLASARAAFRSMHPQVTADSIDMGIKLQIALIAELSPPLTVESVAQQMADRHGAFPWAGPVGNGLSVREYQARFREKARDEVFLARQLGLAGDEAIR